jgi:hypothetical protein
MGIDLVRIDLVGAPRSRVPHNYSIRYGQELTFKFLIGSTLEFAR